MHYLLRVFAPGCVTKSWCVLPRKESRTRTEKPLGEWRSEEHTSELQSRLHLVCRLLLEKKENTCITHGIVLRASGLLWVRLSRAGARGSERRAAGRC